MESKKLIVNGETILLNVQTIIDILESFDLLQEATIVELNGEIVSKGGYDRPVIDGDIIELVQFVGGG